MAQQMNYHGRPIDLRWDCIAQAFAMLLSWDIAERNRNL